ncbi:hypothetical protein CEUSTIGMA_g5276.t1 [Chlamydomonas eustigma]|uniref:Methyltransferase FkbM domain-containing protein n=1 Tax=Chlamydomonas eustigma TaxID=1157962 RepID=A0A250X430_9CHLO|nr:hypothetical protein CEUSTIGMA_g5276.t1 [Chlamydomonas eustigma]|eukprot:GAX77834.1 hypothetical protein CEUSTIGMA_g5276.t1 [Chlamydomonas eustigma]
MYLYRSIFCLAALALYRSALSSNVKTTYLELGANNGHWTRMQMEKADLSSTKCFMFEPQPHLFQSLDDVALKFNCSVIKRPVWTVEKTMKFHRHAVDVASTLIDQSTWNSSATQSFDVTTVNIAEWIPLNIDQQSHVHVRMDIEGAEYMVMRRLISSGVACKFFNVIELEFHALHQKSNYVMRPADVVFPWILRDCGVQVTHSAYYPEEYYNMTMDANCNNCELLRTILPEDGNKRISKSQS